MAKKSSPPGSSGVEPRPFKDEMDDAKKFCLPGPRPTDFLYSDRAASASWLSGLRLPGAQMGLGWKTVGGRG